MTLSAVPYTEPFAAFFTFLGMLYFVQRRWILAALVWGLGGIFRAQGILLGMGFFGWHFILSQSWTNGVLQKKVSVPQMSIKGFD